MPEVKLDTADAAELAEMLQFLSQWLARDPGRLSASLAQFAFLLGGSDGEQLFGP
jgi:hypothetical protein